MEFLWFLLIGLATGWLARNFTKDSDFGVIGNIVVGLIVVLLGFLLLCSFMISANDFFSNIIIAIVGSIVLLFLLHILKKIFIVPGSENRECSVVPDIQTPRRRFQFSLRTLLLSFIPAALIFALVTRLLWPPPLNVAITVESCSLCRYDDHVQDHHSLCAIVQITNLSDRTAWLLGGTYSKCEFVDGKWNWPQTTTIKDGLLQTRYWTRLHSMESTTVLVGPISEKTTELQILFPFTTEWRPTKVHWISSPVFKITKKGQYFFPVFKERATQEEQVLLLP
jgi:uncharacterized membrane protein YeaQ/YmgE (transglycosylase-associated protein family)